MSACVHLASDLHLGVPNDPESKDRERAFVKWLRDAARGEGFAQGKAATELHLVGDVFDFWFEYKHTVPKGGARLMGAIAELTDEGLDVHFHAGNHDMWTFGYLEDELGVAVHRGPIVRSYDGTSCLIGHGDGLGPGDSGYRGLKRMFTSKLCQAAFKCIHPDLGISLAQTWSAHSRKHGDRPLGPMDQEHLYRFAKEWCEAHDRPNVDVFIFGHRHQPIDTGIEGHNARYLNTGDWIVHKTSVVIQNGKTELIQHHSQE